MPLPTLPPRREFASLIRLALPIVAVQVGLMFMGVVDTLMVGRVSAAALAAIALGNLYFFFIALFGMGVLFGLDPVVSQAVGARDDGAIARAMQRGFVLALVLSVLSAVPFVVAEPVMRLFRQPDDVIPLAAGYVYAAAPGIVAFLTFVVVRQTLQAMDRVAPIVMAIVAANVVNAFVNWLLVFGNWGFPEMGPVGTGWATTFSRWTMLVFLLALTLRRLGPYLKPVGRVVFQPRPLGRMLRLGAPIGAQFQLEMGAFAAVALLMGWLGTAQMAGHQVAINLASLTFMVPVGIGQAGAVRVGQGVGRGDPAAARMAVKSALLAGGGFMAFTAVVFLTAPGFLTGLYTDEAAVVAVALALIPIAGVFQIADGLQVVSAGVLRGVGDTTAPFIANLVGFWVVGLPVGVWLGFRTALGPAGLWWGLTLGLMLVALFLVLRVRVRMRREIRRISIDDEDTTVPGEPAVTLG